MKMNKFAMISMIFLSLFSVNAISSDISTAFVAGALSKISLNMSHRGYEEALSKISLNMSHRGYEEAFIKADVANDNQSIKKYSHIVSVFEVSRAYSRSGFLMACLAVTTSDEKLRSEYASIASMCSLTGVCGSVHGQNLLRSTNKAYCL